MYINDGWLMFFAAVSGFVAFCYVSQKVEAAQIRKATARNLARKEAQ